MPEAVAAVMNRRMETDSSVVVMGEEALSFLNELEFPLASELEAKPGEQVSLRVEAPVRPS